MLRAPWRRVCVTGLFAVTLIAAGCGSSSSSSSSSSTSASATTTSSAASSATSAAPSETTVAPTAAQATAAGQKAAANEGPPVKLPTETIGVVNVLRASEAAQRLEAGTDAAAKALGWKVSGVDAAGDPTKSEAGIVTFVNEHVGAIVDISNPTAAITQGLAEARAKNIPVINIGGLQNSRPRSNTTS